MNVSDSTVFANTTGMSGTVTIDQWGDRDPDYAVQVLHNDHYEDFADYFYISGIFKIREKVKVVFANGKTVPPKDHPPCGWGNEFCPETTGKCC